MSTPRILLAFLLLANTTMSGSAQFVEIAQAPGVVHQINSLAYGTKLIDALGVDLTTAGTLVVYNPDLSVYRVLIIPTAPDGMQWATIGYITETLFDLDETNIEFSLTAMGSGISEQAVYIFREDGEQLFVQNPGSMFAYFGMGFSGAPIFTSDNQTYMVVHGGDFNGPTRVYTLPGKLPCMDCYGSPSNLQLGGFTDPGSRSGIVLFPNPASQTVVVELGDSRADAVSLHDAAGRRLSTEWTNGAKQVRYSTAGLAQGRYLVMVERGGLPIATLPLVVER